MHLRSFLMWRHVATAGIGAVLISVLALYWWSNTPPKRPQAVSNSAVWIWGSRGPLPGPKDGRWVTCSVSDLAPDVQCDVWEKSGQRVFSGAFLSYRAKAYRRQEQLAIDLRRTGSLWASVDSNGTSLPIVFLSNEDILIPASEYSRVVQWVGSPGNAR